MRLQPAAPKGAKLNWLICMRNIGCGGRIWSLLARYFTRPSTNPRSSVTWDPTSLRI